MPTAVERIATGEGIIRSIRDPVRLDHPLGSSTWNCFSLSRTFCFSRVAHAVVVTCLARCLPLLREIVDTIFCLYCVSNDLRQRVAMRSPDGMTINLWGLRLRQSTARRVVHCALPHSRVSDSFPRNVLSTPDRTVHSFVERHPSCEHEAARRHTSRRPSRRGPFGSLETPGSWSMGHKP